MWGDSYYECAMGTVSKFPEHRIVRTLAHVPRLDVLFEIIAEETGCDVGPAGAAARRIHQIIAPKET